jgi:hypothetical protein
MKSATAILSFCLSTVSLLAQVPYERIRSAEREPGNWLSYSGNYSSHRFSMLDQINPGNVARLKPVWVHQVSAPGRVETTPLVVDGVMYLTEPPSNVTALDTRTGRVLWHFLRPVPKDVHVCCGQVNRGVALLDELVFVGTVDSHLIALDSKTGQVRWDVPVADYKTGYSITVAPLAVKDKIIVGIAGGEFCFTLRFASRAASTTRARPITSPAACSTAADSPGFATNAATEPSERSSPQPASCNGSSSSILHRSPACSRPRVGLSSPDQPKASFWRWMQAPESLCGILRRGPSFAQIP